MTIAISVIISAFNALSLSPALCAMLLKPKKSVARAAGAVLRVVQPGVRPGHGPLHQRCSGAMIRKTFLSFAFLGIIAFLRRQPRQPLAEFVPAG